jgi:RNA polymerase sigma-70 factor (ECF subfamily)
VSLPGHAAERADRHLVERLARGDGDALGEIYDRHGRRVYSLILRIVRDQGDAEELVQEVFAQAWQQCTRYAPSRGSVAAWLLAMARSRALDRLRARRSRPDTGHDEMPDAPDESPAAEDQLDEATRAAGVRTALATLPLMERLAIELAFFEGYTHTEIAERLEQPLGTVKTRIRQGLLKLRDQLTGDTR